MRKLLPLLLFLALFSSLALARQPKKYQVTGTVLELTDDLIILDKDGEKWEISRSADTKSDVPLKVGQKVTIEYRMAAATTENKDKKPAK